MSGNRVEELEAKVRELEATVEGLTDELIETKERLGAVEDEAGVEPDALVGRGVERDRPVETEPAADDAPGADGEPATGEGPAADGESAETGAEAATESESDADDEGATDSDSGDDIIVA